MADSPWQVQVAALLEQAAQALRTGSRRRAIVALGTAVAYVQRARDQGDRFAQELIAHTLESPKDDPTERFTFKPGELEALTSPNSKK